MVTAVWDAYLWVNDAAGFHEELERRGARIKYQPVVRSYGVKEFAVLDPDGYQIAFGEELPDESS